MEVIYSEQAQEDIAYWKNSGNIAVMKKISALIEDIKKHPFTGIGKPEPLKYDFSGKWSRRINLEDRLIYMVQDESVLILAMRYHYTKK